MFIGNTFGYFLLLICLVLTWLLGQPAEIMKIEEKLCFPPPKYQLSVTLGSVTCFPRLSNFYLKPKSNSALCQGPPKILSVQIVLLILKKYAYIILNYQILATNWTDSFQKHQGILLSFIFDSYNFSDFILNSTRWWWWGGSILYISSLELQRRIVLRSSTERTCLP